MALVNSVAKQQPSQHTESPAGVDSIHESTPIEGREKGKKKEEEKWPISGKQSRSLTAETGRQIKTRPCT